MKNILCLIISCFIFISCTNDEDNFFELEQTSFSINKPSTTLNLHISSNVNWAAIDIPSWIVFSQTTGSGDSDIIINVTENNDPNGQVRTAEIKFIADNKLYLLTIIQNAQVVYTLSILNNTPLSLDHNQHVFTIQISSAQPWYIQSKPTWVQVQPSTGGVGLTSVEITILENDTSSNRFGSTIFATETPFNPNNSTYDILHIEQTRNPATFAKTWSLTTDPIYLGLGDIRYNLELKNNRLNNSIFLTYNTTLIGGKAYIESYDGVRWDYLDNNKYVYCTKPKLAISNLGIPFMSYMTNGPGQAIGYASATSYSQITSGAMLDYLSPSTVNFTDIALTNNNEMVVVYNDNSNNGKVTVKQKTGSLWQTIGLQGFSVGSAQYCNIAVNSNNEIYVAYSDQGVSNKIVVKKYNGSNWETIGQLGFSSSDAENIEMEIGSNNEIFVAYKDIANGSKITVKKYVSGNWETIGTEGFSTNSIKSVSLALNNQNSPYIAYLEDTDNPVIKKFDGTSWVELNKIRIQDGGQFITTASELRIVVGTDNIPFIGMKCSLGVILAKYIN